MLDTGVRLTRSGVSHIVLTHVLTLNQDPWRVYCHEGLHLKQKLQSAGYKQAVEKWDTDSDSDESDDEADLAM